MRDPLDKYACSYGKRLPVSDDDGDDGYIINTKTQSVLHACEMELRATQNCDVVYYNKTDEIRKEGPYKGSGYINDGNN